MPQNCGDFNPWTIRRVTLYEFTWFIYIIDSPDRNIEVWHDLITLQILPGRNIRVQYVRYTSEYIPKLQIHQEYKSIVYGLMQVLFIHTSSPYLPEWMLFTFTVQWKTQIIHNYSPRKSSIFYPQKCSTQVLFNIRLYNIVSEL